jgi:DNA-binding transcriptional ArsR family regulator
VVTSRRPRAERLRALLDELAATDAEATRLRARRRILEAKLHKLYPNGLSSIERSILFFLSTKEGQAVSLRQIHRAIAAARPTAWRTVQQHLFALRDAGYVKTIQLIGRGGTWPHWLLGDLPCEGDDAGS